MFRLFWFCLPERQERKTGETLEDLRRTTSRSGSKEPGLCARPTVRLPSSRPKKQIFNNNIEITEYLLIINKSNILLRYSDMGIKKGSGIKLN